MSQPETELANQGEGTIDDIASGLDGGGEELIQEGSPDNEDDDIDVGPDAGDDDAPAADDEIEIDLDGKPHKVKRSELPNLVRGGMLEADYRKKTAEVAEQRRQYESQVQQIAQERQNAASQLDVFLGHLQRDLIGNQPDPKLIDEDPQEFLRQQAHYQQRAQQFQQALQHRQSLSSAMSAEEQRKQMETVQAENQRLVEKVPEWRDAAVRTKEVGEIAEFLTELGYSKDELNGLVDHRALLVARDAARYRQLQAAKAKKTTATPPARTLRAGQPTGGNDNSARVAAARERMQRNPDDLGALASFAAERGI